MTERVVICGKRKIMGKNNPEEYEVKCCYCSRKIFDVCPDAWGAPSIKGGSLEKKCEKCGKLFIVDFDRGEVNPSPKEPSIRKGFYMTEAGKLNFSLTGERT